MGSPTQNAWTFKVVDHLGKVPNFEIEPMRLASDVMLPRVLELAKVHLAVRELHSPRLSIYSQRDNIIGVTLAAPTAHAGEESYYVDPQRMEGWGTTLADLVPSHQQAVEHQVELALRRMFAGSPTVSPEALLLEHRALVQRWFGYIGKAYDLEKIGWVGPPAIKAAVEGASPPGGEDETFPAKGDSPEKGRRYLVWDPGTHMNNILRVQSVLPAHQLPVTFIVEQDACPTPMPAKSPCTFQEWHARNPKLIAEVT